MLRFIIPLLKERITYLKKRNVYEIRLSIRLDHSKCYSIKIFIKPKIEYDDYITLPRKVMINYNCYYFTSNATPINTFTNPIFACIQKPRESLMFDYT